MRKAIESKIRYLRKDMQNLIEQKDNLLDPEVIRISQELDVVLNQYNIYLINKGFKGV
ncbi:aspartyl-phosphate phosphatase Spo0E family protein [Crassaminicella profunda]|uniref:aspartyl-phosphate phosphatase Spo0E family protein n=1 Tax=Crassaminicella profunda TaxID=1286698 RepID=UPI001CA6ED55|nr:aspartyl-phosphate phosphatase Spo0E family protein [Crassaminicella profunda]QZY54804.1 aspartyl-phosphate phosphatase Spo0E family protein [Crassaminicella profunda]